MITEHGHPVTQSRSHADDACRVTARPRDRATASGGFTLAELVTVVAIIAILASIALPVARFGLRRQKELELRDRLRKITEAIDRYHELMTMPQQPQPGQQVPTVVPAQMQALGSDGYPKDFDELLKGVEMSDGKTVHLIRPRDLVDPMTGRAEWSVLSTKDDPDASTFTNVCSVGGSCSAENLYEIHSTSPAVSLDGKTHYNEW
jgi:general secretion pathway protein G